MQMTHGLALHTNRLVGVARVAVMCPNRMWLEGKCKLENTTLIYKNGWRDLQKKSFGGVHAVANHWYMGTPTGKGSS